MKNERGIYNQAKYLKNHVQRPNRCNSNELILTKYTTGYDKELCIIWPF